MKAKNSTRKAKTKVPSTLDAIEQMLTQARRLENRAYHYLDRATTTRAMANSFLRAEVGRFHGSK
jgi:hypothetical protein